MKKLLLLFVTLIPWLLASCSKTEDTIDTTNSHWLLLYSVNTKPPKLMLVNQPAGTILNQDVYQLNNHKMLATPVKKIADFGGNLYLLLPDEYRIEVMQKSNYKLLDTFDFSKIGKPIDIAFANGSEAFVVNEGKDSICILDLHFGKILDNKIKVGQQPVAIACMGNQVLVANRGSNTISIIDSRDPLKVPDAIQVADAPVFIDFTPDSKATGSDEFKKITAVVVSAGNGKDGQTTGNKTAAYITTIDVLKKSVLKTNDLSAGSIKAVDQIPVGLSVTSTGWAFIPTQSYLLRVDTKTLDKVLQVDKNEYLSSYYDSGRDKLLLTRKKGTKLEFVSADNLLGNAEMVIPLPDLLIALLSL